MPDWKDFVESGVASTIPVSTFPVWFNPVLACVILKHCNSKPDDGNNNATAGDNGTSTTTTTTATASARVVKRALLFEREGQVMTESERKWRVGVFLVVFLVEEIGLADDRNKLVAGLIANLVVAIKVYRILRRKKREEWMEMRKRDLEGKGGSKVYHPFSLPSTLWV
ncbi:MAG: hypothetical protein LQ338_002519 [Usnochroma carphineum]|nr:MAG: hypothetical protein LQ338_002519 [Usnochroma carphineum]